METRRAFLRVTGVGLFAIVAGCAKDGDETDVGADTDAGDTSADTDVDTDVGTDVETDIVDCEPTSDDQEGPFWIEGVPVREELDLYGEDAVGLTLTGTVRDEATCAPIAAVVEIWHADSLGKYDNDSTEMRYRGQAATDADGNYRFHTIMPGKYPGRPLHIHMKVWVRGVERLTTQVYFADQTDNIGVPADLVIALAGTDERSGVFDTTV